MANILFELQGKGICIDLSEGGRVRKWDTHLS